MTPRRWKLVAAASAERSLGRLPEKIAAPVVEFMLKPLSENPKRVGTQLGRELSGTWVARRGAYRILYELDDTDRVVRVVDIDHRADIYRPRGSSGG